ncbi:Zfp36l1 [Symbiodinium necroappetens]|uniref:Zfp36l1 protein n=1 Tax=Symbiodinium necroappetens TaxID=1628268 RepID=A0A812TDQ3_9DINO|nr:Zfp36l1 [Symbiodinium necroappetens]
MAVEVASAVDALSAPWWLPYCAMLVMLEFALLALWFLVSSAQKMWSNSRKTEVQQESLDTEPVPGSESGHLLVANAAPCGPRGKWAPSYSTEPTEFDSGICHGSWLCIHKPTADAERMKAGDYPFADHLHTRKRLWEFRLQLKFRESVPAGNVFFGCEQDRYYHVGTIERYISSSVIALLRKASGDAMYQTHGDDPKSVQGEAERPTIAFPLWVMDQLIITEEGDEPPTLNFLDPGFRNGPPGRAQEFGSYCPLRKMSAAKGKVAKVATVEGKVQKMKLMELVQRTIMCKFFRAGLCKRGSGCTFAHDEAELLSAPDLYKTSLCSKFQRSHYCKKGDRCRYAHGTEELRELPSRAWIDKSRGSASASTASFGDVSEEADSSSDTEQICLRVKNTFLEFGYSESRPMKRTVRPPGPNLGAFLSRAGIPRPLSGDATPSLETRVQDPDFSSYGTIRALDRKRMQEVMQGLDFQPGKTFTFGFWCIAQFVDAVGWRVPARGVIPEVKLNEIGTPIYITMYLLSNRDEWNAELPALPPVASVDDELREKMQKNNCGSLPKT